MKKNNFFTIKTWKNLNKIMFKNRELLIKIKNFLENITEKTTKIICPKCGRIVKGIIDHKNIMLIWTGYCKKCNYHITESEWDEVK